MRKDGLSPVGPTPATVLVRHRRLGIVRINASDYDPDVHIERLGPVDDPAGVERARFEAGVEAHTSQPRKYSCGADYGVSYDIA